MAWEDVEGRSGEGNEERVPYTKFAEGNTLIRVLDDEPYSFWNHWMQKQQTGAVCLGKDCPICSVIASQKASKETQTYSSQRRHAIRVWNYATNQMEAMLQGQEFFQQLLNLHKEVGDIKTYDIKVTRKGMGTDTKYMLLPTPPKEFAITEGIADLDFKEFLAPMTKEQMLMLMEGKSKEEVFGKKSE